MSHFSLHEHTQLNRLCYFRFFDVLRASKGSYYSKSTLLILIEAGVVPCGAVKRLSVHHLSADYIFRSFGIMGVHKSENRVQLKPVLGAWSVLHISLLVMNGLS